MKTEGILQAKHGIYGSNIFFWPDHHFKLIKDGGFSSVIVRTDTSPDIARSLMQMGYRVIIQTLEDFAGNPWADPRGCAEKYYRRAAPFTNFSDILIIENEPNVFLGRHTRWYAEQFTRYIRAVWAHFKWLDPGSYWKLVSPAMAVPPDREPKMWYDISKDTLELFDYIGVHAYWQFNWQVEHPDWGRQYEFVHDLFPDKEIIITEYGHSHPNASNKDKVESYIEFLTNLPTYVESAHLFILGGTDDWKIFHLNEEIADKLYEALL